MKLRKATAEQTQAIADAHEMVRKAAYLLRVGAVRPRLVRDLRAIQKRIDGAHRHALRARFAERYFPEKCR